MWRNTTVSLTLFKDKIDDKDEENKKTATFSPQRVAILFGLHYFCHERIK